MIQEKIKYWGVQHVRYGIGRGPKHGGSDEPQDEGETHTTGGYVVAFVKGSHLGDSTELATKLGQDHKPIDE
jgi:hypothetical protein